MMNNDVFDYKTKCARWYLPGEPKKVTNIITVMFSEKYLNSGIDRDFILNLSKECQDKGWEVENDFIKNSYEVESIELFPYQNISGKVAGINIHINYVTNKNITCLKKDKYHLPDNEDFKYKIIDMIAEKIKEKLNLGESNDSKR